METKYTIHFARPVIERLALEVTASSEQEAILLAVHQLMTNPEKEKHWTGEFDENNYTGFVESICTQDELNKHDSFDELDGDSEEANMHKYLILHAHMNMAEGGIIPQPWLTQENPFMIADLCQDWNAQLTALEQGELESYANSLHPIKNATIIPFPNRNNKPET